MDTCDIASKAMDTATRLYARNTSQAADIREYMARNDIAVNLMMRGLSDPELILLVLGHAEAADTLVMSKINPDNLEDIVGQNYMDWEKFVALKAMNAKKPTPVVDDDGTEDDLPFPADESEVAADEA